MTNKITVVLSVVGTRPNFVKLAPVAWALDRREGVRHVVLHTGQHYDVGMSDTFFSELQIPIPDYNLEVGSGTHAQQTAAIMQRLEPLLTQERPDVVLVYGDVNSTVAGALVAAKLGITVAHVEAGLRSHDWSMPEEINRAVTDRLSQILFAPSLDGVQNLRREGVPEERIEFVGNVVIDTLVATLPRAKQLDGPSKHGLNGEPYVLLTLHRPSNVDDADRLRGVMEGIALLANSNQVLFPVHPRTRRRLAETNIGFDMVRLVDPVPYVEMVGLVASAALVITDSGGLQEETSFLGVPCLTVRLNTERPITCTKGTNRLVSPEPKAIVAAAQQALGSQKRVGISIPRWDGRAAERIIRVLCDGEHFGWESGT